MADVSRKYKIPISSLRDHYEGRIRNRKMNPKTILNKEEEDKLVHRADGALGTSNDTNAN